MGRPHWYVDLYILTNSFSLSTAHTLTSLKYPFTFSHTRDYIYIPGTIGGSFGLCFGFSLITGLEFMFFIFDYISVPGYERLKLRKTSRLAARARNLKL